jgi:cell division protein FtsB
VATTSKKKPVGQKAAAQVLLSLQASGFVVTILALLVAGVVILSPSLRILAEQQQEIVQLRADVAATAEEVFDLEEQRDRWRDPSYVETQARERLMFVYPGDITYLVIDDLGDDLNEEETVISQDIVAAQTDWRQALLASYLVAATTSRSGVVEPDSGSEELPEPAGETGQ